MTMAVCIVNYNTRDLLRDCLQSVSKETQDEIVVIDNASSDGSAGMVSTEFPSVRLLENRENTGYGAAANRAINSCAADTVLLLNSDTRLQAGAIQAISRYFDFHGNAAVVGPRIVNPDGTFQTSSFHNPTPLHIFLYLTNLYKHIQLFPILRRRSLQAWSLNTAERVPWVIGAAFGIRREAFEAVGGFDESFFMYFEEVDLCNRLARAGWEVHFAPITEVIHLGGASTQQNKVQMTLQYFTSLMHFYRRHYSRIRMAELTILLESTALARLIDGRIKLFITRDDRLRAGLARDMDLWKGLLLICRENQALME